MYIPNPHNYPFVNHKDCNRQNNNLNNLEWCTRMYNNQSINIGVHGLFTGDAVTYVPGSGSNRLNIASENVATYFVKKISDNEISLYRSRANVFNNVFIPDFVST